MGIPQNTPTEVVRASNCIPILLLTSTPWDDGIYLSNIMFLDETGVRHVLKRTGSSGFAFEDIMVDYPYTWKQGTTNQYARVYKDGDDYVFSGGNPYSNERYYSGKFVAIPK